MYYPLHVHTALGSICDSTLQISDYVKRAKEIGLKSLAITDHGSLAAMFTFIDECNANDIKPIIGMEAYEVIDVNEKVKRYNHLILLAKNDNGLKNLLQIHNDAQLRGFYYKPRTDRAALERWGKDIIALSACTSGSIPSAIIEGDADRCFEQISFYQKCFDHFFLEIQPGKFTEQFEVNDALAYLSKELGIPIVVTNDIHYLLKKDAKYHDYHVKLGRKRDKEKISEEAMIYPDTCFWFMEESDIKNAFTLSDYVTKDIIDQGIRNAEWISQQCNLSTDFKVRIPMVNLSEESTLRSLCYQRLNLISQKKPCPQVYVDRLEHELSVISQKGFCGYFLIVHDYVNWAKQNDIKVGPGRGSAAGCLVAYLLQITAVDPIKYGLVFERFMDPEREAIPDK